MEVMVAETETNEAAIRSEANEVNFMINPDWEPEIDRRPLKDSAETEGFRCYTVILFLLALIFIGFRIGLGILHLIALLYGKCKLHRRKDLVQFTEKSLPGVSILKPLVNSADPSLFQNLETFFLLDYPKYEIIFCIQCTESEDSRLKMYVDSLRNKYPSVQSKVFYGGESVSVNPKINNMHPGYKAAIYEFILISDSGIRMRSDTLSDMVSHMTDSVGLVHQMPFSCDRSGLSATLEKVYFGTSHARMYLAANCIGINCATGMSALMRKEILEAEGGLKAFGKYLAEDYFMAQAVQDRGLHTVICSQPALQNAGDSSIQLFQNRITRWAKLRAAMVPLTILLEPLSECILLGLLTAWSVFYLFRWDPLLFFLLHILIWFLMDWVLIHVVQNGSLPFNKFEFLLMWIYREISAPVLFIWAQIEPDIRWRNNYFRLKWGGLVEPLDRKIHLWKKQKNEQVT